ncbi:GcrA family cell cycle regulator [Rhizobium leguminosarum]|uniref:GcrA family cell cycle regulator n=1 Tax=Rhizobium leguminosarum TaxID=384 RepID=UPI0004846C6E|nr:GcrA family cell cycle regulator [Rhizobium leguminosarum]
MNVHAKIKVGKKAVWDDATKREMGKMWNNGQSAGRISAKFGVSRNVVVGLAMRNPDLFTPKGKGTPKYARWGGRKPQPKQPGEARARPTHDNVGHKLRNMHNTRKARMEAVQREASDFLAGTSPLLQIAPDDALRLSTGKELVDLGVHECRWVLNNGSPFLFCADATEGAVYCMHHAKRVYQPREAR